jgi:hypothetical protein
MTVRAEDFRLCRFAEITADLERVARSKAKAPTDPWIAAGDFDYSLEKGADTELVAAETSWL